LSVCGEEIGILSVNQVKIEGLSIHYNCREAFSQNPEKYGVKPIEKTFLFA